MFKCEKDLQKCEGALNRWNVIAIASNWILKHAVNMETDTHENLNRPYASEFAQI